MSASETHSEPAPRVALYLIEINRISYLIAKTLAIGGCRVWVRFEVSPEELQNLEQPGPAEREYCSWLFSDDQIEVANTADEIPNVDVLLYDIGHRRPRYPDELRRLMAKAQRVVAWNTNDHEQAWWRNLRAELATLVKFANFVPGTRRTVVSSGRTILRPTAMLRRSARQGYFVHPIFLCEPKLRAEMFPCDSDADEPSQRPVRLIFSGNAEPQSRLCLIEELKQFLQGHSDVRLVSHYEDVPEHSIARGTVKTVLWMVRSDPHDPQWYLRNDVVPPTKWPRVLRQCDFVVCPPGYESKTHRVVESLLQGTIPILDCPEEYDLDLRDGVNCLVVGGGCWTAALQRALDMREEEICRLRQAVRALALAKLHFAGATQHWLGKMGLQPKKLDAVG